MGPEWVRVGGDKKDGGNEMGVFEIVLAGIVVPAALVLILAGAWRIAAGGLVPGMVISGIGTLAVAAVVAHFLAEPIVVMASRHWPVLTALPLVEGLLTLVLAEGLKVWSIRWALIMNDGLTWRRFGILAAWTGAGFALADTCLQFYRHGGDLPLLQSLAMGPMHVVNAVIAAWALWRGAHGGGRFFTMAAFGLAIGLHATFAYLAPTAGWGMGLAVVALLAAALFALSRPDEAADGARLNDVRKIPCNMRAEEIGITD